MDNESYLKHISWTELQDQFGLGVVAKGCCLQGCVAFREEEVWRRGLSRVFRLRDDDDKELQVSISGEVALSEEEENDMGLGAILSITNPMLHQFVDGESGVKIESRSDFEVVTSSQRVTLSSGEKLKLGSTMKEKGNSWLSKKVYFRASSNYEAAVQLLNTITSDSESSVEIVEKAKQLQSACACNLMLIGITEGKWSAVVGIGEEIVRNGVQGETRVRVLYRMALAFHKSNSPDAALQHASLARSAATSCSAEVQEDVEKLFIELANKRSTQQQINGLRQLAWGKAIQVEGMHPKFGYKAPLLQDQSVKKRVSFVFRDLSGASQSLIKKHFLYTTRHKAFYGEEARYVEDVLRIKTVVYVNASSFRSPSFVSLALSPPEVVVPSTPAVKLGKPDEISLPVNHRVILTVDLAQWFLARWVVVVFRVMGFLGLSFIVNLIVRWYLRLVVKSGEEGKILASSPLTSLFTSVFSHPQNYPVLFCGDELAVTVGEEYCNLLGSVPNDCELNKEESHTAINDNIRQAKAFLSCV